MSRSGKEPRGVAAGKLTFWVCVGAAIFCAGVAWYTANAALWIMAGIALASGIAASRIGRDR
jgi:hypothetical protein